MTDIYKEKFFIVCTLLEEKCLREKISCMTKFNKQPCRLIKELQETEQKFWKFNTIEDSGI